MPFIRGRNNQDPFDTPEVRAAQIRVVEEAVASGEIEMNSEVEDYINARTNPPNRRGGNPNNPNAGFREGGTRTKIPQDCVEAAKSMNFIGTQEKLDFLSDCAASNADDTEITSSVEETGTATGTGTGAATGNSGKTKRDLSNKLLSNTTLIIFLGLAAAGIYLAYNRGLFKSNNI
tara:strand:+ start:80 stop:607 length:528 start_codon:yes stop_codon:yes gene_type:complete